MAKTYSTMLELGTPAPDFRLPDPVGRVYTLSDFAGAPVLLVMFLCNHCPYVKHIRRELAALVREFQPRGVAAVGINANDVQAYPEDSPARMAEEVQAVGYTFPYLFDETQAVAKAYRAACTPDFFVFDRQRRLFYRGQFDDSRPRVEQPLPVTGRDLRVALEAALAGQAPPAVQKPSLGCNIKWKPGNEPDYFKV
ncbi:MAG: thioredoxin family protein [Verrucomicrobiae bacterium]|nr:thioredoxin family protein [Verrucomicrobiae bacterium]